MSDFTGKLKMTEKVADYMELQAASLIVKNQIKIMAETMQHENHRIMWTNMLMPTELFYAAGMVPIQTELIAGWISTLQFSHRFIQKARMCGFANEICSYHKAVIGCLEEGELPPPSFAAFSSHICDGGSMLLRYLKDRFGTKILLIDVPYYNSKPNNQKLYRAMQSAISWIEKNTGNQITSESVRHTVEHSNNARMYFVMANELRKHNTLIWGNLAIRNLFGATFLFGSKLGEQVARTYYEELKDREKCTIEGKRILWYHFAPLFDDRIMKFFEQELQCVIAFDITGYIYYEPLTEDWIQGLTDKMLSHFLLGDSRKRITLYRHILKQFRIDGVVIFMHQGCRAIPCSSWELKEVSKDMKIPFLELPGDCIDKNGLSVEQTKLRMEAFRERLGNHTYVYGN